MQGLAEIWQNFSPVEQARLAQILQAMPATSPLPSWARLSSIHARAHPWRPAQIEAVLKIILQSEADLEALVARGLKNPRSLNVEERRAVFLVVGQKWWFQENISSLRQWSLQSLRPSRLLPGGDIPLEEILHSAEQTGFWKSLFQLQASTREIATVLADSQGQARMLKLIELRRAELSTAMQSAKGLRAMRLDYEQSRLRLLEQMLKTEEAQWSDTIHRFAREDFAKQNSPRLQRFLFEQAPAGARAVETLAAYGMAFGLLSYGVEKAFPSPQPLPPPPRESEEIQLKPLPPAPSEDDLDRAIRDFNEGKISRAEMQKKYPQLFK